MTARCRSCRCLCMSWRVSGSHKGFWSHACRPPSAEALALVQAPPAGTPAGAARLAAELEELSAGLRLLATFCSRDPQTALELLHVELPTSSAAEGLRGPDLLTLAVQAVAVLAAQPEPPTAVIGGWRL